jgi:methyl-accepting chemotaxis protein
LISLRNFTIKNKILSLALSAAMGMTIVTVLVMYISSSHISSELVDTFSQESHHNMENLIKNTYNSCEVTDQLLTKVMLKKLDEANLMIRKSGKISLSNETFQWNCTNQVTKEAKQVSLPKLLIGNQWVGYNPDFEKYQPIIDDLAEKYHTFTIFQRINEAGDMLRVATNVKLENGKRAIGTYIPAINPDGKNNPVLEKTLKGETYYGNAFVVNDYYQSVYEPIKDNNGKVIGMLYSGVSLNSTNKLRESIVNLKVGKTGYMYVLGASGARKGYYIISKNGKRDGENVWETKDDSGELIIQKIINQATSERPGKITFIKYPWINPGDTKAQTKIVALTYFKEFDWVIGAGTNIEEIEESSIIIQKGFNEIYLYIAVISLISLIGIFFVSIYISNKIAHPIQKSIVIMEKIAHGNIKESIEDINNLEKWYLK